MSRLYPPLLRGDGVGGVVRVYFFIGVDGEVTDRRIDESSGIPALDAVALEVGRVMEFKPAQLGQCAVPVWVSLPITFEVRS